MTRKTIAAYLWGIMTATVIFAVIMSITGQANKSDPIPLESVEEPEVSEEPPVTVAEPIPEESFAAAQAETPGDRSETVEEEPVSRYPEITSEEREIVAAIVYLEARGESAEGQQAVAEVVFNRLISDRFPDTVEGVIYQSGQFTPAKYIASTMPTEVQYEAVDKALFGENILPLNVVYFSGAAQNSRVWGSIGNHVFCCE